MISLTTSLSFLFIMLSQTISRVMSCVIIYPMELSPVPLSDPPENMTGSHIRFLFGLASDGVYMCPPCYQWGGSLLHCLFTLTLVGGYFLLHFPGSHLHRTLSGILPYEARTFLTCSLSFLQPRSLVLLKPCLTILPHFLRNISDIRLVDRAFGDYFSDFFDSKPENFYNS